MATRKTVGSSSSIRSAKSSSAKRRTRSSSPPPPPVSAAASGAASTSSPPANAAQTPDLLDMDQAIALLQTTRPTFYRWLRAGNIKGMKVGRQWRFDRREVDRFLKGEEPRIALSADINPLLRALDDKLAEHHGQPAQPDGDHPVRNLLWRLIGLGRALRASDLHIEPMQREADRHIAFRYRIDHALHEMASGDIRLLTPIIDEWKRLAAMDVMEKTLPQDARLSIQPPEGKLDMRLCFLPSIMGESLSVRFLPSILATPLNLSQLGYAPQDLARITAAANARWGLIVVAGPAGCGKTTVAYSILLSVVKPTTKALSIEDPVEFQLPGVTQVQFNAKAGLTFSRAIRAFLRCDPDVVYVAEIRDAETMHLALQTALTGHLVLTTMHTPTAAATLNRMVHLEAPPWLVSDAVTLVIAQRLVRCLCPHCAQACDLPPHLLTTALPLAQHGGLDWNTLHPTWRRPVGCDRCHGLGFKGRRMICEILATSPAIADALRRGETDAQVQAVAVREGMTTMAADGIRLAAQGICSLEEVLSIAPRE